MKELGDVIKEINEIKNHNIYKEVMKTNYKQTIKFALYGIMFIAFLVVAFLCFYEISGKHCIKQCQEEHITTNCNDYCF